MCLGDKFEVGRDKETEQDGEFAPEARHHSLRWDQIRVFACVKISFEV